MRPLRSALSSIWILVILILPVGNAAAQDQPPTSTATSAKTDAQGAVILKEPSWQTVLDKLFGAPDNGLLDGKKSFEFRAQNLSLTADQSAAFFNSTSTSPQDLKTLIDAAIALHGQVRMEGTIDGKPFDLKLAGRELKLEGITLTATQRESLMTALRSISGLREMKINALVDGKETRIVVAGGKERISLDRAERPDNARVEDKQKPDRPQKIDIEHKADIDHKVDINRGGRADTRIEGRIGGAIEKPELPRVGK